MTSKLVLPPWSIDGQTPDFYSRYVDEVQQRVANNARLEFEAIWAEHQRTATPRSLVTDEVSAKINHLNDEIRGSALWDNTALRHKVLDAAIPQTLIELLPLEKLLQRVPENYLRAMFSSYLASHYVYQEGLAASEVQFIEFLAPFLSGTSPM